MILLPQIKSLSLGVVTQLCCGKSQLIQSLPFLLHFSCILATDVYHISRCCAECAFGGLLSNKRMECGCFENSPMALPVHVINCHCRRANSQLLFTVILNYIPVRFGNAKICCCSVAMFCLTLCDPVDRSTPGLPDHHHLLEFTQTHVHRVGDAIQPSHPPLSPSTPAPNPSQHEGLFQ